MKDTKLKLLSELIRRKELGDFTKYEGYLKEENLDEFSKEIIEEYRASLATHYALLNNLIDKLIHHLDQ